MLEGPGATTRALPGLLLIILVVAALSALESQAEVGYHADCTTCHGRDSARPAGIPDAPRSSCAPCHADRSGAHAGFDLEGAPECESGCLACHDPHEGVGPSQLRASRTGAASMSLDPGSRRCTDCHEGHVATRPGSGTHPVGIRVRLGSAHGDEHAFVLPLADVALTASTSDDVIACTTCHDVHGSTNPFLLRWPKDEFVEACSTCHVERRPARRMSPVEAFLVDD